MTIVYLAIGSNLSNPEQQATQALDALAKIPNTQVLQCSRFYRSIPLGSIKQPDYLNAVVQLATNLAPEPFLDETQRIEYSQGRVRNGVRWEARPLDLDILLFGQQIIHSERLTIPHYAMYHREFVLYPLAEIAPNLRLPDGQLITELLTQVPRNQLTFWSD